LGTGQNSGLLIPNLVAIAKAIGIEATSVDTLVQLEQAFKQASNGPRLINVNLKMHIIFYYCFLDFRIFLFELFFF
jgi:thiamine pyrophosphate-dependent acetolactate synthase large subunit-like protein